MVDLSIIIVSWNVASLLRACLRSIYSSPIGSYTLEVIVIDSASSDDSVALVRSEFPQVKLVPQVENIGFSRSNNVGLELASGRYLFLLNPDTELVGDVLVQLLTYMDAHLTVGIIGPHTLNTDGTTQSTRRRFPSLAVGFIESTWLQPLAPKNLLQHYYAADLADEDISAIDWVQGSALLARRDVYTQIGGLDAGYVMYSEEMDWCKRAKLAGWEVIYYGKAEIIHHGGKSSEQVTARKHIHFQTSKLRYFRKFHGWLPAQVLRLFLLLNYLWQIIIEALKGLLGHKRALRQERVQAYWQVVRSGLKVN
ncbi:MAG: glycosyltransferase family 2 protein [Chloroflexi bacterium]|nr:glycosyltransferase family 2 protein [Chloroflexota bacterium]MCC6893561.1 glycosyltransferase family 2 protein [Anaerolineae bacterium]